MQTIDRIHLVLVPVTEPDRAVAFYERLGFEKRVDFDWVDGHRWIELFPRGGGAGIALVPGAPPVATGLILPVDDLDAALEELRADGLDADPAIARAGSPTEITLGTVTLAEPFPPMAHVRDPDGNSVLLIGPG